jgi:hypothetical protein
MKASALLISTLVSINFISPTAYAVESAMDNAIVETRPVTTESEFKPHVGLLTGLATPEGSYRSGTEYGVTLGYQPYIPFGVGIELSTSQSNPSEGPDSRELQRTKVLAQATYNFGGNIPVLSKTYIGLAAGPMLETINNDDNWVIGTMPTAGFDIPFTLQNGKDLSVGLNARYLVSSSGAPNTFSLNAMAKYWF